MTEPWHPAAPLRRPLPLWRRPSTVYAVLALAWGLGAVAAYRVYLRPFWSRYGARIVYDAADLWRALGEMAGVIAMLVLVLRPWSFHADPARRVAMAALASVGAIVFLGAPMHSNPLQLAAVRWTAMLSAVLVMTALVVYPAYLLANMSSPRTKRSR